MSKGLGQKIIIKFTQDLMGDVTGSADAFTIKGQEPKHVGGILIDGDYQAESCSRPPIPRLWSIDEPIMLDDAGGVAEIILPEIQAGQADKYNSSTQNGSRTTCTIQGSNNWWYRTFLQYDMSAVMGREIISADIYLYAHSRNDRAGQGRTNIARIAEEWDEFTLSWNTQPAVIGTYLPENAPPISLNTWGYWGVADLVREWADGTHPNYGLHILNLNEGAFRHDWKIRNRRYGDGDFATYIKAQVTQVEDNKEVLITNIETQGDARLRWTSEEPAGTKVLIKHNASGEWTEAVDGEVINVTSDLIISVTLSTDSPESTPVLADLWLEELEMPQDRILIDMNPIKKFNNAEGLLEVSYDMAKGDLNGLGGPVESFTETFMPVGLEPKPNPIIADRFTVSPTINIDFIEVVYSDRYGSVNLITTADCTIDFIPVEDINP